MRKSRMFFLAATAAVTVTANAEMFQISVHNHGPQPLSPVFFSAGDATFDIFQLGGTASLSIKNIAETGNTTEMFNIAAGAGSSVASYGRVGNAPIAPGNMATATFEANSTHAYFSFASMLGQTNDGYIGEGVSSMGLMLFDGGNAKGFSVMVFGSRAWDAGSEINTQNATDLGFLGGSGNPLEGGMIRVHDTIISGVGDSWQLMPDWELSTHLATIDVSVVPEPATLAALGLGVAALARRKRGGRR